MAMRADDDASAIRARLADLANSRQIRRARCSRPCPACSAWWRRHRWRLRKPGQKFRVGAGGVFGGEFDVVAECPRHADRVARLLRACSRNLQLVLQVKVGGGEKDVDARAAADSSACAARSMSCGRRAPGRNHRARNGGATACTASKSPSEAMGKPASITSTPSCSS